MTSELHKAVEDFISLVATDPRGTLIGHQPDLFAYMSTPQKEAYSAMCLAFERESEHEAGRVE